ncbi:adhesion G-protein coupled receptor G2 [Salminus brasiliensis]|uniref:adhesion G-protein coupled receptor G2 n=1 Tax=Salminus brasiliensis TaxID=930266 RepID=UPI003B83770E
MAVIFVLYASGVRNTCTLNNICSNIVVFDGGYTGLVQHPKMGNFCNMSGVLPPHNVCVLSFDTTNDLINNLLMVLRENISSVNTQDVSSHGQPQRFLKEMFKNNKENLNKSNVTEIIQKKYAKINEKIYSKYLQIVTEATDDNNTSDNSSNTTTKSCTIDTLGVWLLINKVNNYQLNITRKSDTRPNAKIFFVDGKCNITTMNFTKCQGDTIQVYMNGACNITCLNTESACTNANYMSCDLKTNANVDFIEFQGQSPNCSKCGSPVQSVELTIAMENTTSLFPKEDSTTDKAEVLANLTVNILEQMGNKTSASVSIGEVQGIFVKPKDPAKLKSTSFVYSPDKNLGIIEDNTQIEAYPRLISVPKEAFEKALSQNISKLFTAVFRFPNFTKDEKNSTVLNDEVYSIDMGAEIANLTNTINITFKKVDKQKQATPQCFSWSGSGSKPNWTTEGCNTTRISDSVSCECEHLTFFAVLMIPNPPDNSSTISSTDLNNLTYITSIGCGLSIFFLGVALFMHFLLRRARKSEAAQILINLMVALVLLNLTFLTNEYVANTDSIIGCKLMAGFMHYCLLSTFTWFGLEALHLCLQLARNSNPIRHYLTKICVAGWAPPAIVVTVLFCMQKYDQIVIYSDTGKNVKMCWIKDSVVHYVVNIGYYSVIFAFTFTTFIIMLRWIVLLKRTAAGHHKAPADSGKHTKTGTSDVLTVMGLSCTLGLTWGFAFFAYGALRLPSYYIFTILNSFQGFFLFIYYYNTSKIVGERPPISADTSNTTEATQMENPYEKPKTF